MQKRTKCDPLVLLTIKTKRYKFTKYFEHKLTIVKTI